MSRGFHQKQKNIFQLPSEIDGSDLFAMPAERPPDLLVDSQEWQEYTATTGGHIAEQIHADISREQYIDFLLEKVMRLSHESSRSLPEIIRQVCTGNNYNTFFEPNTTPQKLDESLCLELAQHLLGPRGRRHGVTPEVRKQLVDRSADLQHRYPQSQQLLATLATSIGQMRGLASHQKLDVMCKLSILMLFAPPHELRGLDRRVEQHIFIGTMCSGATWSQALRETLSLTSSIEMKNAGPYYDHRLDDFISFLRAAAAGLPRLPAILSDIPLSSPLDERFAERDHPELGLYRARYESVQTGLIRLIEQGLEERDLYDAYLYLTQQYFEKIRPEMPPEYQSVLINFKLSTPVLPPYLVDLRETKTNFTRESLIELYLTHAPGGAREFFLTMNAEDQDHVMRHIEYLPDGIRFLDDAGREICVMDNKNLTVPKNALKKNKIEQDEQGNTFFQRDAMMDYTKDNNIAIPTDTLYEKMLRVMPANDYKKKYSRCKAGLQLHRLLGGTLSGFRYGGEASLVDDYGCFRSSSGYNSDNAFALRSDGDGGKLSSYGRNNLFPVRALRTA